MPETTRSSPSAEMTMFANILPWGPEVFDMWPSSCTTASARSNSGLPWRSLLFRARSWACRGTAARSAPSSVATSEPREASTSARIRGLAVSTVPAPLSCPAGVIRRNCRPADWCARGARIVTICSGVFVLAAAGLVNGKRVTTHWKYVETLRARYPRVTVEPAVLFVEDGRILTSAGSAAGIDACLHLVRSDYGAQIAHLVARRLVMSPQRDGGQAQYVPVHLKAAPRCTLTPTLDWMQSRIADRLSVVEVARHAGMSTRTFARRFGEATGTTPHQWLTHQRVFAAQRLLESTDRSIDSVAEAVGLQTGATLRHHFARELSTTPTAYRRRFSRTLKGR